MNATITDKTIVVLWSPHAQYFHIETFAEMIQKNAKICATKIEGGDYILLCLVDTYPEADEVIARFEQAQERLEKVT